MRHVEGVSNASRQPVCQPCQCQTDVSVSAVCQSASAEYLRCRNGSSSLPDADRFRRYSALAALNQIRPLICDGLESAAASGGLVQRQSR